jgi:hypothetical protein
MAKISRNALSLACHVRDVNLKPIDLYAVQDRGIAPRRSVTGL